MQRLSFAASILLLAFAGYSLASPSPGSAPQGSPQQQQPQAPQRDNQVRAVETWYGVYEPGDVQIVEDTNNPGFKRQIQSKIKPPRTNSARIPLIPGTRFGIGYDLRGPRQGDIISLRHVRVLPPPGIRGPDGKVHPFLATNNNLPVGGEDLFIGWTFGKGDLTGTWTLQVFEGTRLLLERRFEIYRP
jgi:hypothetical protein